MSERMLERMSEDMSEIMSDCSKYCFNFVSVQGSEFGLAAMAEGVVECSETIFIGTANQVASAAS